MKISNLLALLYSDIFDYPLKKEEMERWEIKVQSAKCPPALTSSKRSRAGKVQSDNVKFKTDKLFKKNGGFYFLEGRKEIINLRKEREKYSENKIKIAEKIANLLKIIPTIKMVALTGNVAMKNADKNDDIDLLIITSSKTLWLTRFLATILVELTGKRRHPGRKRVKDKICLNMFVDESYLPTPENERNLFTAHEVVQLVPLWERNNTYLKFLKENEWVREYLPEAIKIPIFKFHFSQENLLKASFSIKNKKIKESILEKIFKNLQLWYMRKKKTKEKISDVIIRFHPEDKTEFVLSEYNKRVEKLVVSSQ